MYFFSNNEDDLKPKKFKTKKQEENISFLDTVASNYMKGSHHYFSELNNKVTGNVKFGYGSYINIDENIGIARR